MRGSDKSTTVTKKTTAMLSNVVALVVVLAILVCTQSQVPPPRQNETTEGPATHNDRPSVLVGSSDEMIPSPHLSSVKQCSVYCSGEILASIQNANIFEDSKTFVDMPLKHDPETVIEAFNNISIKNYSSLVQFLSENFLPAGSELTSWVPSDFVAFPPFISKIQDANYRAFAQILNKMWTSLGKQLIPDVAINPQRYSMISQKRPFIVPGERFNEFYYWDSYWIIKGLLTCGMNETAKGIILNAIDLVLEYGFVPNGARVYYLNRSQPPLLSEMVLYYYESTHDLDLVKQALPVLEREYQFWMKTEHRVQLDDGLILNRYYSSNDLPRPEAYREDLAHTAHMSPEDANKFYTNIAAGAESGEDFTLRWFSSGTNLSTIETTSIIPVDLNAIMYKFENNMLKLHQFVGITPTIDFVRAMEQRKTAMDRYLYNEKYSQWFDYSLKNSSHIIKHYPSNWFPLWSGAFNRTDEKFKNQTVVSMLTSGLIQSGGVISTLGDSGQQWDSPNAWAPHQSLLVQSLLELATPNGIELAETIAWQWIKAAYVGFQKYGIMQEKYNGFIPGDPGKGGEYPPQKGFGWSNGVTIEFLSMYGNLQ
eukprot:TRINITY_DN4290_c0_g1_i1.p1 TRINITY_DN4290_c0_g1~~TRINITY_DN4290_c0_g1_i1.p1  ORF type:complete len:594 (-),score=87.12 TRINITY_DN4290_c0_g1_i1:61-1842(-)